MQVQNSRLVEISKKGEPTWTSLDRKNLKQKLMRLISPRMKLDELLLEEKTIGE